MTTEQMLEEFERLSQEERIQLVQDLWDRIAANPSEVPPLTEGQSAELERRLKAHAENPDQTIPAEEVFAQFQRTKRPPEA